MLLAAGASHPLADVSQGAGRIDYRIEIPAGACALLRRAKRS